MPHYKSYFDSKFIGAWDLLGKDVTVKIRKVEAETLTSVGGRTSKKPVVYFDKTEKALALNKTNAKTIAGMYGTNTDAWVGRLITLYPTMTDMAGESVDAVRVRPSIPRAKSKGLASQPVDPVMREKQEHAAMKAERESADDVTAGGNPIRIHPEEVPE